MKRRGLGVVLIFIGAIISLANLTITGAVVGSESMPGWRVLGAAFVVGGAVLVFLAERESGLIKIVSNVKQDESLLKKAKELEKYNYTKRH